MTIYATIKRRAVAAFCSAAVLLGSPALAQDKDDYDPGMAESVLSEEILPLAKEISGLLAEVSPKKDGQVMPVMLQFVPFVPVKPGQVQRITFHCPWGATICAPFLRACTATLNDCTCSDYGSIEPDPC